MPERYSHPASDTRDRIPLRDHLQDVATRAKALAPDQTTPAGTPLRELVTRVALVHDFGKLTTWFQEHIGIRFWDSDGPHDHAPLGAVLAYYVLDRTGANGEDPLAGFVAVARHHGRLPNTDDYVRKTTVGEAAAGDLRQESLRQQIDNIGHHVPKLADSIIETATDGRGSWAEFAELVRERSLFQTIFQQVAGFGSSPQLALHPVSDDFYATVLQVWSILVLADKTGAAHAPEYAYDSTPPDRERLTEYIEALGGDETSPREKRLNGYRREARLAILDNVRAFADHDDSKLATLTLPTGMGKTLTGLNAAMTLRDTSSSHRIVYALPFTSVIDQVVDEVRDIYPETRVTAGQDAGLLTVHHHLADTRIDLGDQVVDGNEYGDLERMLGESWRSGLVVTTFVQLFESLAGPGNIQSMKLPALYDSIVVIDEPQGLPLDWWPLVERLVEILTDDYGATVIAMTATQPQLFTTSATELVDDPGRYYRGIKRVEYVLDDSVEAFDDAAGTLGYDEAAATIAAETTGTDSALAVCNTIDSARELTKAVARRIETVKVGRVYADLLASNPDGDALADAVVRRDGIPLIHLSTRLRPCDRLTLISTIKALTSWNETLIVVSTQLVEAGVDISFDRVYRDFAPADSIVQAAGRCNRSYERDRGLVTVWWLGPPGDRQLTPAEAVYNYQDESRLSVTWGALTSVREAESTLSEPTVAWRAVREYYRRLAKRNVGNDEYVTFVDDAKAHRLGACSLIDQGQAVNVVVCRSDANRDLITEDIPNAWEQQAFDELNVLLDETKSLQVSVPAYQGSSEVDTLRQLDPIPFPQDIDLRWLDATRGKATDYFDETIGLVVPDDTVNRRFL